MVLGLRPLALTVVLACGGCGGGLFACGSDMDCASAGTAGTCAQEGVCAFPDEGCESGLRYGSHAGDLSGQWVVPEGTTSGDASTIGSSATTPITLDASDPSGPVDSGDTADVTSLASEDGSTMNPVSATGGSTTPDSTSEEGTTGDPIDPQLLVWLRFDDDDGDDAYDNSGVLGGVAPCFAQECPEGGNGMADFNGTSECVTVPHNDAFAGALTVALWVYVDTDVATQMQLFGKRRGDVAANSWEAFLDPPTPVLTAYAHGSSLVVTDTPAPPIESWFHVAATWDDANVALWLDGELVGETPIVEVLPDDYPVTFGCDDDAGIGTGFLNGLLADVRIYGEVLADDEIIDLAMVAPPAPP
jgi:hypothetical protein